MSEYDFSNKAFSVETYFQDGFEKVCDVLNDNNQWKYSNVNADLMYSDHSSWVYFITVDNIIVKVGETGLKLATKTLDGNTAKGSSKGRLSRYLNGDQTDEYIRRNLYEYCERELVSIYVKKCPIKDSTIIVAGNKVKIQSKIHKDLELIYLDYIENQTGIHPMLNKQRK